MWFMPRILEHELSERILVSCQVSLGPFGILPPTNGRHVFCAPCRTCSGTPPSASARCARNTWKNEATTSRFLDFLLISTSSLKNSRTGTHSYPNRKTGKKFKRMPKNHPPPNTKTIKKPPPCPHILLLVPGSNIDPGVYCPEQYIPGTYLVYIAAKHR